MSQNELFALALCLSWVARLPFSNWTLPEFGDALIQPVNTALSLVRMLRKGVGRLGARHVWAGMGAPHEDPWLQRSKRGCGPLAAGEARMTSRGYLRGVSNCLLTLTLKVHSNW
jgi:hypothetical protein